MALTEGWSRIYVINRCRIEPDRDKAIACYIAAGLSEADAVAAADNMKDPWNKRSPLFKPWFEGE